MSAADAVRSVPLITREALFGNPVRSGGTISADGQWLVTSGEDNRFRLWRLREAARRR